MAATHLALQSDVDFRICYVHLKAPCSPCALCVKLKAEQKQHVSKDTKTWKRLSAHLFKYMSAV